MEKEKVIFQLNGENYPYSFDRSRLKLGEKILVEFDDLGRPKDFYLDNKPSCIPYWVIWIAPSEWCVSLQDKYYIDVSIEERIMKAVETYSDKETVSKGLAIAASDIRPERMFMQSEYEKSRVAIIITVADRLELCSRLAETITAGQLLYHQTPLIAYLLLTCFDRLGQPANWLDFGSWLVSREKQKERESIAFEAQNNAIIAAIKLHDSYNKLYGVSHSFYQFLQEVISDELRKELLDSIEIEIVDNPPELSNRRVSDTKTKEAFLFQLRNNYTHKAQFVPGMPRALSPDDNLSKTAWTFFDQYIEQEKWKCVFVKNWPDILEKVVRAGLATYIKRISVSEA
jgi:hypothetical protein